MNIITFKPIFHHNTNPFALEPRVGIDPKCNTFALGIPYLPPINSMQPPIYKCDPHLPNVTPNTSRWNIGHGGFPHVGT